MDFTNIAYRDAVNRLKYLLAESYASDNSSSKYQKENINEDTKKPIFNDISKYLSPSTRAKFLTPEKNIKPFSTVKNDTNLVNISYPQTVDVLSKNKIDKINSAPEVLNFIEKQENYIEQLEKESKFCREELSCLLGKVRDVVNENEVLTEHVRAEYGDRDSKNSDDTSESEYNVPTSTPKKRLKSTKFNLSGPKIIYESRIIELEAELAQTNIDLKRLQSENSELKKKFLVSDSSQSSTATQSETHRQQIQELQNDKRNLEGTIRQLQSEIDEIKLQNNKNAIKTQRNLNLAEKAIFEKNHAEIEIKRLQDELEMQHIRIRELQHEMSRKISEERTNAERRINFQVDQLDGDLNCQWEQMSKLQIELERQKRIEGDLKRDLAQKNMQIDELKMELKTKRSNYLSDITQMNAEKQSLEQDITSLSLQLEKSERQTKMETNRLGAEINSLRQRLNKADADLLHTRRENLRLNNEIAAMEKELALNGIKSETKPASDINKAIADIQQKHAGQVSELEEMVQSQRNLMDKLTSECKNLTEKLEDTTHKYKLELSKLQSNVEFLNDKIIHNDTITNINLTTGQHEFEQSENIESIQESHPIVSNANISNQLNEQSYITEHTNNNFKYNTNEKDRYEPGEKYMEQTFDTQQLSNENTKSYDNERKYSPESDGNQYPGIKGTDYPNEYETGGFQMQYDQSGYDGNIYQGDYDQNFEQQQQQQQQYDPQQYQSYNQNYGQSYQTNTNMYSPSTNLPTKSISGPNIKSNTNNESKIQPRTSNSSMGPTNSGNGGKSMSKQFTKES